MAIKNKVQIITYADSFGGNLKNLGYLLNHQFSNVFQGGVHILPPFLSSADRGFAPTTYYSIEPSFGSWEDIRNIGETHDVLIDLMVNHISRQSSYFQDFVKKGRQSKYADLFITIDKIWPDGDPTTEDIAKIFLRKPDHPFSDIKIESTHLIERVWTSFGTRDWSEQIDLDINSPVTKKLFLDILDHMSQNGVTIVRLDAIGYVIKKSGTSCFFVEPEIFDFMNWIKKEAGILKIDLLPEVHAHYSYQLKLAEKGFWVYDFVLPSLILHTLFSQDSSALQKYLEICPRQQFTMLDCHDGIPIQPDLDDILEIDEAQKIVQTCIERGANLNRILSVEHQRRPEFDAHQINCTYYSALDRNDDAYIAARAIQFFAPGVPQVYYVGLLAGENDQTKVEQTGEGREINRHNYTLQEIDEALNKNVVQRLLKLIHFRNQHPAFEGEFKVISSSSKFINLTWENGSHCCQLKINLCNLETSIIYTNESGLVDTYCP